MLIRMTINKYINISNEGEKIWPKRRKNTYKLSDRQKRAWQDVMWFEEIAKDKDSLDGTEGKTCFFPT